MFKVIFEWKTLHSAIYWRVSDLLKFQFDSSKGWKNIKISLLENNFSNTFKFQPFHPLLKSFFQLLTHPKTFFIIKKFQRGEEQKKLENFLQEFKFFPLKVFSHFTRVWVFFLLLLFSRWCVQKEKFSRLCLWAKKNHKKRSRGTKKKCHRGAVKCGGEEIKIARFCMRDDNRIFIVNYWNLCGKVFNGYFERFFAIKMLNWKVFVWIKNCSFAVVLLLVGNFDYWAEKLVNLEVLIWLNGNLDRN